MDITQIFLSITLTTITIFLIVVGFQLTQIFGELRKTLKKTNDIIEGFENGINEISSFLGGFRTFFNILDSVKKRRLLEKLEETIKKRLT